MPSQTQAQSRLAAALAASIFFAGLVLTVLGSIPAL